MKKELYFFFLTIFQNKDKIKEIKGESKMPTWAIHLATAKKISEKININKNLFTFGNILPDIPNGYVIKEIAHHISHARTHFETDILIVEHKEKRYNLKTFVETYKEKFSNPLILGYYVHLLTDYYWNDKTYGERGIFDGEKNRIGLILKDGERILCSKETARQIKTQDFRIFSQYIYNHHLAEEIRYQEEINTYLQEVDWMKIEKTDVEKTIQYIKDRCIGNIPVIEKEEDIEYKIYSEKEMIELLEASIAFILKMLEKHARYLLK